MLKTNKGAVLDEILRCRLREMSDTEIVGVIADKTGETLSRPYVQKLRKSQAYTDRLEMVSAVVDTLLDATLKWE